MPASHPPVVAALPPQGLSPREAAQRLIAEGPNTLPLTPPRNLGLRVLDLLREPMFALLVLAALLYMLLGDLLEGVTLAVFVLAELALTFYQEGQSANAIAALQSLSQPLARVIRDGTAVQIAAHELVRGDLLLLAEGDRISADGTLLSADHLQIDES